MIEQPLQFDDLSPLLAALCDGTIDGAGFARLEQWLTAEPAARQWYIAYMDLHGELCWDHRRNEERGTRNEELPEERERGEGRGEREEPSVHHSSFFVPGFSPLPSPLSPLPSFVGGALFSYLMATLIFGVGLLVGWFYKVSHDTQVAWQSPRSAAERWLAPAPKMEFVGQITGMIDCQWSDPNTATIDRTYVALGRKYALSSGLMEITYDTGAKVILQGPVTYEVESRNGGYISIGKLTARLETKGEGGRGKADKSPNLQISKSSNQESPFRLPPSPFVVRTPTATVTDLGTEFGVEVDTGGDCEVHVLQGLVRASFLGRSGKAVQTFDLREGEARRYTNELAQVTPVFSADRKKFAALRIASPDEQRQRWLAYSRRLREDPTLVAYYTFEAFPGGNTATLPNMSAAGSALDARVENAEWVYGRMPGKYGLLFHGPGSGDKVVLPEPQRFNFAGPFSVAVWFQVARFREGSVSALIAKCGTTWRIQRFGTTNCLTIDTIDDDPPHSLRPHTDVADSRWHLAVAVIEPRKRSHYKRLYLDGRLEAEVEVPAPLADRDTAVWLGAANIAPNREFEGRIDEAAIFARTLSPPEVEAMFEAGRPAAVQPIHRDDDGNGTGQSGAE